ncbi:MAG: hypothetical protein ACO1OQ_09130 [Rufibacter sp.]
MKSLLSLLLLIPFLSLAQKQVIKGKIVLEKEPMPGTTILITGTQIADTSNIEGDFTLSFQKTKNPINLEIKTLGPFPKIKVIGIELNDEINLGLIELVLNKFYSVEEYKKLDSLQRAKVLPSTHHGQLLGYYDISKIGNRILPCPLNPKKEMALNFDSIKNEVIIPFEAIVCCK